MGDPFLKRLWDTIKLPPAPPRPEWERSVWRRIWDAVKPPPPVAVSPEVRNRRWLLFGGAGAAILIAASITAARAYVHSAPTRAEAALQEGVRLAAIGDNVRALERFSLAISIRPEWADAYLQRGVAYRNRDETDHALLDIEHAIELNPDLASAHAMLGTILLVQKDSRRAITEFSAALAIAPNANTYYQRGQVYESLGEHENAVRDYDAAIELLPNAPYVYRARASAELNLGDRDAAKRDRSLADAIEHK
jgi:tetratricopeptide (TPR) repeat protein